MGRVRRSALRAGALLATAAGVVPMIRRRRRRRADHRVFVFAYHDVCAEGPEREGVISAARLRRQVRALKREYGFATLARAGELLAEPGALGQDLVVLTFDDGYAGNFEAAWPVLRAEGVPATFFVTTGFLDGKGLWFDLARRALAAAARPRGAPLPARLRGSLELVFGEWPGAWSPARIEGAVEHLKGVSPAARDRLLAELAAAALTLAPAARPLSWAQVRELEAAGCEIGCHTVDHPILAQLPRRRQEQEIWQSRQRVAEETGRPPVSFAFPNGRARDFDGATCELLRAAGFRTACTTIRGSNRPGCDPLRLRRLGIGSDPAYVVAARMSGLGELAVAGSIPGVARGLAIDGGT
jgi:peptidoglycan/xylan/chitin deacetylase (PgdA/CDA1 family)